MRRPDDRPADGDRHPRVCTPPSICSARPVVKRRETSYSRLENSSNGRSGDSVHDTRRVTHSPVHGSDRPMRRTGALWPDYYASSVPVRDCCRALHILLSAMVTTRSHNLSTPKTHRAYRMLVTWYLVLSNAEFVTRNTWLENAKSAPSTRTRRRQNYMRSAVEERHQAASHVRKCLSVRIRDARPKLTIWWEAAMPVPQDLSSAKLVETFNRDGEWEFLALRAA